MQPVRNTDLHLKLIDLGPIRGIIILFILPLIGKVRRNKNIFFQISINKFENLKIYLLFGLTVKKLCVHLRKQLPVGLPLNNCFESFTKTFKNTRQV